MKKEHKYKDETEIKRQIYEQVSLTEEHGHTRANHTSNFIHCRIYLSRLDAFSDLFRPKIIGDSIKFLIRLIRKF